MKRAVISVILAVALLVLPASGALAATSAQVTVTAVPGIVSITETQTTWTINGITRSGVISENTTYYSNPQGDNVTPSATVLANECYFKIDNDSSVNITITVDFGDFTGGDAMTNGNDGSAGATTFGAYSYHEGMTYSSKVVAESSGSGALKTNLPSTDNLSWGIEIITQWNDWTSVDPQTSTVTVTATAT
ncbi:hypothetical protein ES706_04256 [subsurface metagenome]